VMPPSTSKESLSHGASTFGDSRIARLPQICRVSREYNSGTELILWSKRALDEFSDAARVTCNKKCQMSDWSAF
jgi:hypothetical protein